MVSSASHYEKVIVRTPYGRYTWNETLGTVAFFSHHQSTSSWHASLQKNDDLGALREIALHMIHQVVHLRGIYAAQQLIKEIDDGKDSGSSGKTTPQQTETETS